MIGSPLRSTMMLAGLRSRCTIFCWCASTSQGEFADRDQNVPLVLKFVRRNEVRQRTSVDVLHREVVRPVNLSDIENGTDMRAAKRRRRTRFPIEPLDRLRARAVLKWGVLIATCRVSCVSSAR